MPQLPEKVGKYHIVGVAGEGNMGIVYVGYDPFADRDVAVKVCSNLGHGDDSARDMARKMFFNEAHTAGALDHPHILKVLDAGEERGEPYIVMEYVDGGLTIEPYCRKGRLLPVEEAAAFAAKCASALDYAHRRGVIHRDIKPTNIMLTPERDVKLGDFGIAQTLLDDTTAANGMMGSPRYMSPEQVQELPLTGQTDIYSLGVVMYELLTGQPPFSSSSLAALFNQIQHAPPTPPRQLRAEIPEALESIVCCALEKDARYRYQNAAELASDLAALYTQLRPAPSQALAPRERFELLRDMSFFNDFADAELRELLRGATWNTLRSGEQLELPAAGGTHISLVVYGDVESYTRAGTVALLGPGACFGDCDGATRDVRLRARNDSVVLGVSLRSLCAMTEATQLRFSTQFINALVRRLARHRMQEPSSEAEHGSTH
jgi:serine/threonine protein kinase